MINLIKSAEIKKNIILYAFICVSLIVSGALFVNYAAAKSALDNKKNNYIASLKSEDYIKWIDFNVKLSTLQKALKYDIDSHGTETPLNWVELIAYAAAKNWGNLGA